MPPSVLRTAITCNRDDDGSISGTDARRPPPQGAVGGRRPADRSRRPAHALTLTQSAVSQHVAALEREVGLALVERGTRPLAAHRRRLRADAPRDGDLRAARRRRAGARARSPAAATGGCASAASRRRSATLRAARPSRTSASAIRRSSLTVVDDHLQRLVPRLEAGELDLALIYEHDALPDVAARDLVRVPLFDDAFRPCCPRATGWRGRGAPLALADLAGEPWIGGAPASAWYRIVARGLRGRPASRPRRGSRPTTRSPSRRSSRPGSASPSSPASPLTRPLAGRRGPGAAARRARPAGSPSRGRATPTAGRPSPRWSRPSSTRRRRDRLRRAPAADRPAARRGRCASCATTRAGAPRSASATCAPTTTCSSSDRGSTGRRRSPPRSTPPAT